MKHILHIAVLGLLFCACKAPEAREPITVQSGSFIKESAERNKKLNLKEREYIQTLIDQQSGTDYIASESGFWYTYIIKNETDSLTAGFGDLLKFTYDVKDLNGTTIYSEDELGLQEYSMDQEEIFTGLREGLKLMKAQETVTFIFPSQKAYGYYGDTNKIGTNIPLICKVTLNSITQHNND